MNNQYQQKIKKVTTPLVNFKIISPIGGFGNHVRNFLLLDNQFSFNLNPVQHLYDTLAGNSWPNYNDYCNYGLNSCSQCVRDEITYLSKQHPFMLVKQVSSVQDKLNFFNKMVYPDTRTWQNWLFYEWKWRDSLDNLIKFSHDLPKNILPNQKILAFTIDPTLALKSYLKLNSNLNNKPIPDFLNSIENSNKKILSFKSENIQIFSADSLFQQNLDIILFDQIVNWCNFDISYSESQLLHERWYSLHKKAEVEFVNYVNQCYG